MLRLLLNEVDMYLKKAKINAKIIKPKNVQVPRHTIGSIFLSYTLFCFKAPCIHHNASFLWFFYLRCIRRWRRNYGSSDILHYLVVRRNTSLCAANWAKPKTYACNVLLLKFVRKCFMKHTHKTLTKIDVKIGCLNFAWIFLSF